jgi:hypothetical protein
MHLFIWHLKVQWEVEERATSCNEQQNKIDQYWHSLIYAVNVGTQKKTTEAKTA